MKPSANGFILGASFALCTLVALVVATAAHAQNYPARPITAIIPFSGGSASDVVSRIMFDKMSRSMGQPIIVENRPGAGGNVGTAAVARAAPDGYTLIGGGSGPIAANKTLYKELGYDPERDR
jgi:tripartite-type tricarboxylate transporter receptor subunit TctC